jgi:hypothetical protein
MPVDPRFAEASRYAEESLEMLSCAATLAKEGNQRGARDCLKAVAVLFGSQMSDVLSGMREDLAAVANVIQLHGRNGSLGFVSAHEATMHVWTAAEVLMIQGDNPEVPLDLLEIIGVNPSLLGAMVVSERAKLLARTPPPDAAEGLTPGEQDILTALRGAKRPLPAKDIAREADLDLDTVKHYVGPKNPLRKLGLITWVRGGYKVSAT